MRASTLKGSDNNRDKCRSASAAEGYHAGAHRVPYQRPQLLRYGHVSELTRGANGSGNDGGPAYMNRQPQGPGCQYFPWLPWCR